MNLQAEIKKLIDSGENPKRAVAIAYSMQLKKAQLGGTTMNFPYSTMEQDPNYNYYANNSPYFASDRTNLGLPQMKPLRDPGIPSNDMFGIQPSTNEIDIEEQRQLIDYQAPDQGILNPQQAEQDYQNKDYYSKLNIYNPYGGMGLDQSLFYAGQGFGNKKPGQAALGTGLSLLKGARGFLSGYSSGKASRESAESSYQQQFRPNTNAVYMQEGGQFFGQETMFPIRKIEPSTDEQGVAGYTYYQGKLPTDAGYDPSLHKLFFTKEEHISKQKPGSQDLYEPNLINYLNKTDGKVNVRVKQEGGSISVAEAMTGAYLTETEEAPTVELEKDEFTLNSQTGEIQKVVGEKHTNGGVKSDLPAGSQVLSNYTKIGAKTAKELKEMFDISVKPKDTFAKVMDKIDAKIGYKETIEEETEYLKTLEKQQTLDTNDTTKKLNEQHLAKELKENEEKKSELEDKRIEAFQTLFQEQESRPKKGDGTEVLKKEGGNVYDPNVLNLAKQYNLSPDRVIELMEEGGKTKMYQEGGEAQVSPEQMMQQIAQSLQQGVDPNQIIEQLIQSGIGHEEAMQLVQSIVQQMQGQVPQEEVPMAQEGGFTFSTRTAPTLQGYDTEGVSILDQDTLSDVELMQPYTGKGYGAKMADVEKTMNIHKWYFDTDEKKKAFREAVAKEGEQPEVKMFQEAYNNEIENRAIRAGVPEQDVKKILQDVGFSKEGVKKLDGLFGAFTSTRPLYNFTKKDGEVKVVDETPTEIDPTTNQPIRGKDLGAKTVMANLPQDLLLPPSSLANLYKGEVRFGELDPTKMSAEAQNVEAERQRQTASKELYFLNPQQRAALTASGLGQTQMATNQAIGQAEMFNAQQKQQVDQFNLQNNMKEDLTNIELNKDFERRNLAGQGIYEANTRGYYNNLNAINRQNFADVRDLNLANAAFDKYQTDGSNIMFMPSDTVLNSQGSMKQITQEQYNRMTDAQKQAYKAMTTIKNG